MLGAQACRWDIGGLAGDWPVGVAHIWEKGRGPFARKP